MSSFYLCFKLAILGMLDHPHQESQYKYVRNLHAYLYTKNILHHLVLFGDIVKKKQTFKFTCRQKINIIARVFLEIFAKITKYLILGTLVMLGYPHQNRYNQLVENFTVYLHAIKNSAIHFFLEILHFKK